ncbi:MAG: hypothetical protein SOX56_01165 [[Pasteurella] mairii]|uniref:Lipoprotein n=1 Tax=[Pasteurella] mairii TaxID=757 RepID=A0A379B4I9_9PAST|nr:hypothetical protein [[Pasteurella] mairii]SUB33199.1 Uncharacterised protein [[Pasteurella] mairii]
MKMIFVMIMTALLSACYITPTRHVQVDQGRHLGQIKQVTGVKIHPNVIQIKPVKVKPVKVKKGKVKYQSARYDR